MFIAIGSLAGFGRETEEGGGGRVPMSLLADGEGKVGERKRGMRRTSGCLRWDSWWLEMGSLRKSRGDGGDDHWRRRFGGVW